jgi:hypothetical protein
MGRFRLPVPSPAVSSFRGVDSRTRDDGICSFNNEYAVSGGNTRSLIRLCRRASVSCPC